MDEFRAHLDGYEERRKKTDKMHQQNQEAIADIQSDVTEIRESQTEIRESQLRQEDTYKKHAQDDTEFQKKTELAIQQLNDLAPIIREKLLPAYEREQQDEIMWKRLKEKMKSGSFWVGTLMGFAGFGYGMLMFIKQFTK